MADEVYNKANTTAESSISQLKSLLLSPDWISLGESNSVQGYSMSMGELELIKAVGILNYDPLTVCNYLMKDQSGLEWDETLKETKTPHDFGDLKVVHQTYKAIWPVNDRDFIFAIKKIQENDDLLIVAKSIDIGIPEQPDTVRGECITSGFILKNIEDIATELTYCVCVDPKGQIPKQIVNILARMQVNNINKIRTALSKSNT